MRESMSFEEEDKREQYAEDVHDAFKLEEAEAALLALQEQLKNTSPAEQFDIEELKRKIAIQEVVLRLHRSVLSDETDEPQKPTLH